jgi:hypothetical protein
MRSLSAMLGKSSVLVVGMIYEAQFAGKLTLV